LYLIVLQFSQFFDIIFIPIHQYKTGQRKGWEMDIQNLLPYLVFLFFAVAWIIAIVFGNRTPEGKVSNGTIILLLVATIVSGGTSAYVRFNLHVSNPIHSVVEMIFFAVIAGMFTSAILQKIRILVIIWAIDLLVIGLPLLKSVIKG